jgi:hypothetical protein
VTEPHGPHAVTLRVRDEVGVAREAELAEGGVPLPVGVLTDPAGVQLRGPGGAAPVQTRVLERWPGGSIRWLGVAFLADVPAQASAEYVLETGSSAEVAKGSRVTATEGLEGVSIDTGRVSFLVRRAPFDPLVGLADVAGFALAITDPDGREFCAEADPAARLRVLEAGPVVARVLASGGYRAPDGAGLLDFEIELEAVAGSAEVALDCRFVNREAAPSTVIASWTAHIDCVEPAAALTGVFEAAYRTREPFTIHQRGEGHGKGIFVVSRIEPDGVEWADLSDPGHRAQWEWSELSGRHAKNWIEVESGHGSRLAIAVPRFLDDNPSAMHYDGEGVTVGLWPAEAGPIELTQGVAATRRIVLRAEAGLPGDAPRFAERSASRLVVETGEAAFATAATGEVLRRSPSRFPRLESHVRGELFSWCLVGQATGFLDRGDAVQTENLAGPRTGYSANNEHDAIFSLCLHYLRSGERAYLDSAESYADHVIDVDVIHASTRNEFEHGGVRAHGRNHVHYVPARTAAGEVETSIDTGHMWVEGLLLLGAITAHARYVDAARGIGECLLALESIGWTRPEPGPRNSGWPLVALAALYRATGDERYLAAARRVAASAIAAQGADGRWTMRLGFWDGYCAWQNAVLLVGLARLVAVDPQPAGDVETSFRSGAAALLDLGRYDDGGFIYLDRSDYRWVSRTALILEALEAAYEVTGDERFLRAGLESGAAAYGPSPGTATSNDIAEWRGRLPFLGALERAGLLDDLALAANPTF